MKVLNKEIGSERTDIEVKRGLRVIMENGDKFLIKEDIEGFMEITKEFSEISEKININPRMSNQITIQ